MTTAIPHNGGSPYAPKATAASVAAGLVATGIGPTVHIPPASVTTEQTSALRRIRDLVGSIGHHEIAPTEITDAGCLWVWFDHGRFCVFRDGSHGLTRYGKQRLFGLVVGELRRPVAAS